MYQVKLGAKDLYYPASEDAVIYDTEWTEDIGQAGEFSFKVPPQNPLYAELTQGALITILKNNVEVWRGEIKEISKDFANIADVYCLEDLSWLADEFMLPAAITDDTYAQRFQAAIDAYNLNRPAERQFLVGIITNVTDTSACNWTTEYEWSILECLRNCICKDDGYIRVRRVVSGGTVNRYIDIVRLADYGVMATQPIEYGYNLLNYVKESDYGNLTNVLTPYGDELDSEVYDGYNQRLQGTTITEATSVSVYGRHSKAVIFDGVDDVDQLNALASAYLTRYSQPQLTMEVQAVDLADIDGIAEIQIGDSVRIIAPPFAVDQWLYLTEIRRDIQNIDKNTITLSGHVQSRRTLTEQSIGTAEAVKNLPSKSSILDAAFKNVIALLNGVEGGYVTFETDGTDHITEIRIANNMDFEQATNCWRWNMGGLAHMSRVYPTDDWQVNVAMDMTGQVSADFIKTGELIANNGVFELNMATGQVTMQNGSFSGTLNAARGTMSDGTGTLSLSGGDLHMSNSQSGGPGLFATKRESPYYSCWGAVNSAAQDSYGAGGYIETPTKNVVQAGVDVSDIRLKEDINDIDADFAKALILGIQPKTFHYKEGNKLPAELQFGVIAQEIQSIEKQYGITEENRLCYTQKDGMLAVQYKQLIAPIIKVIQEQQKEIEKLKGESNG
jgi:hypothetical protein